MFDSYYSSVVCFNILNNSDNGSQKLSRSVKYTDVQPWPNAGHISADNGFVEFVELSFVGE